MRREARLVGAMLGLVASVLASHPVAAEATAPAGPVAARYGGPTDRYPHNVMGSVRPQTDLIVDLGDCAACLSGRSTVAVRLPAARVFEDFAPFLADLDGDGTAEIVTVESDLQRGSRLTVWDVVTGQDGPTLERAATIDFIGTRFRWLAPVGAADFDGDGRLEIAYVETPHRARVLKIVRREGSRLVEVARIPGVINHVIGDEEVQSRIETCKDGPRIVLLDATGARMLAISLAGGAVRISDIGPAPAPMRLGPAQACAAP